MASSDGDMADDESDDSENDFGASILVRDIIKKSTTDIQADPKMSESEERIFSKIRYKSENAADGAGCSKYMFSDGDNEWLYSASTPSFGQHVDANMFKTRDKGKEKYSSGTSQKSRDINKRPASSSESLLYHRNHSDKLVLETLWGAKQYQPTEEGIPKTNTDVKDLHKKIDFYRQVSRDDLNMIGEDEEDDVKEKMEYAKRIKDTKKKMREPSRNRLGNAMRNSVHGFRQLFRPCCMKKRTK